MLIFVNQSNVPNVSLTLFNKKLGLAKVLISEALIAESVWITTWVRFFYWVWSLVNCKQLWVCELKSLASDIRDPRIYGAVCSCKHEYEKVTRYILIVGVTRVQIKVLSCIWQSKRCFTSVCCLLYFITLVRNLSKVIILTAWISTEQWLIVVVYSNRSTIFY